MPSKNHSKQSPTQIANTLYLKKLLGMETLPPSMDALVAHYRSLDRLRFAAFQTLLHGIVDAPLPSFEAALDASPLLPLPSKEPKGCWGELRYAFKSEIAAGAHPRGIALTPTDVELSWDVLLRRFKVPSTTQLRWVPAYHNAMRRYCQTHNIR